MKKYLIGLGLLISASASAGIQVDETRVVYPGDQKSASLSIHNDAHDTYMVQTWLDTGDKSATPDNLPIQVVPPILKLAGSQDAILRFIYAGQGLPADRESVFWVNVQEIPPAPRQDNVLQVAVRTRIKLFYRPAPVTATLQSVAQGLTWQHDGNGLRVSNPGPLHVTFSEITLKGAGNKTWKVNADMVDPMGSLHIPLPAGGASASGLSFSYINDFGGHTAIENVAIR